MVLPGCEKSLGLMKLRNKHEANRENNDPTLSIYIFLYLHICYINRHILCTSIYTYRLYSIKHMENLKRTNSRKIKVPKPAKKRKNGHFEKHDNIGNNRKGCWTIASKTSHSYLNGFIRDTDWLRQGLLPLPSL